MKNEIAFVQLYPNKHVLDIASEIESISGLKIKYFFFEGVRQERLGQGWNVPHNHTIIPSSFRKGFHVHLRKILSYKTCFIFGSVSPFPWMFMIFLTCIHLKNRVFFISEGLRKRPSFAKRIISRVLMNRKTVTYLAVGSRAAEDYRDLGMSKWKIRRFAFAEKYNRFRGGNRDYEDEQPFIVLAVGQLIPRKNFSQVILALASYKDGRSVILRILGSGVEHDLLASLAEEVLPESVKLELLGHCGPEQLEREFASADVFVSSSLYDGWGVVVNQALAYGLPIIASRGTRSASGNLVEHNKNGFIYETTNSLSEFLMLIINDFDLRRSMSKDSFKRAECWSVSQIASRTVSVMRDEKINFETGLLKVL
ncbi:glycosyltransferase family 4 protein [Akkermansiaceae bacterium]|nr:glycosyltransferase family 4 protein [Akkermansiaceae bacterium]